MRRLILALGTAALAATQACAIPEARAASLHSWQAANIIEQSQWMSAKQEQEPAAPPRLVEHPNGLVSLEFSSDYISAENATLLGDAARSAADCAFTPGLFINDDGSLEATFGIPTSAVDARFVDRFTPQAYPARIGLVCFALTGAAGAPTSLTGDVIVYSDDGAAGAPGTLLGSQPFSITNIPQPAAAGAPAAWFAVDLSDLNLSVASGSVYIGVRYLPSSPNISITADTTANGRPVGFAGGFLSSNGGTSWTAVQSAGTGAFLNYRALMIRATFDNGAPALVFPQPYCQTFTAQANVEPITRVVFAGIDNGSAPTVGTQPALENFTNVSGQVAPGETYTISVEGNTGGNFTDQYRVFFDWNRDGQFALAESVYIGTITNSTGIDGIQASASVTVPADLAPGTYRMRVHKRFGSANTAANFPCTTGGFGQTEDYTLVVTADEPGEARVQVAHLAPFASGAASEVTVRLNGDDALTNFGYGDSTAYITLPAIEYLIEVVLADNTVAAAATVTLAADTDYTVAAIGDGVNQPVSLLALVDNNDAPAAGSFKLRLAHAAPFAAGPATADIRLADNTLIATVDFGDATGYTELPEGTYDLRVTAPGGDPVLIDLLPVTLDAGAILTAFATGEGNNQPLGAFALPSDAEGFFLPLVPPPPTPAFFPGELTTSSPTFFNPGGQTAGSGGPGGQYYCVREFTVSASGQYTIEMASPNSTGTPSDALDTFLRLHANSFDPANPTGAIAANDDFTGTLTVLPGPFAGTVGPSGTGFSGAQPASRVFNVSLTAGTPYFLVQTSWVRSTAPPVSGSSGQPVGVFYTGIAGVGSVSVGADNCPPVVSVPEARVQVAHLAPFASGAASEVTVRLNGEDALTNFGYGDSTAYITLPAIEYLIEVVLADNTVAASATVELQADTDYTVAAIGDGVNQPVSLLALVDNNDAPAAGSFKLRLAHAAPFAAGPASADIRLADNTLIATVDFGDATGYTELPAGTYDLRVTAPGGDPVLIDILPVTLDAGGILTAFATGDGNNQPLGAFALPSDAEGFFLPVVGSPEIAVDPESLSFNVVAGDTDSAVIDISNVGTGVLNWNVFTDSTDAAGRNPALDEVFTMDNFVAISAPNGGAPVVQTRTGGVQSSGRVVGFSFQGSVTGITGNGTWASDLCLRIQGPDGSSYSVGGFGTGVPNCGVNNWTFNGSASTNDGTYSHTSPSVWAFPPGAADAGTWTFTFTHGWNSASAANMNWSNVTITLHKESVALPCDSPSAISWLSLTPASGSTNQGESSPVLVEVDADGLAAGAYDALLCIASDDTAGNELLVVPVELTVTAPDAPEITVNPTSLSAMATTGDSTTATLNIGNVGTAALVWNIEETPVSRFDPRGHFPRVEYVPVFDARSAARASVLAQALDPIYIEKRRQEEGSLAGASTRSEFFGHHGLFGGALEAYSTAGFSRSDFVRLDPLVPGTLTSIVDPGPGTIFAGTFINGERNRKFFVAATGGALTRGAYGYIDTATGAVTQLGVLTGLPGTGSPTSAAWDPVTGNVYINVSVAAGDQRLFQVNIDAGSAALVGTISTAGTVIALAFNSEGQLFGLEIAQDVLLAIDKTNGNAAVIGPVGVNANFAQDMDFDRATDTLYWAAYLGGGNSNIRTVNTSTGASTLVGPIQDGAELLSFAIAQDVALSVDCSNPADVPWLSVDVANGTIGVGAPDTEVTVTFNAAGLGAGVYEAALCVNSNDPERPIVGVPVEFTVATQDISDLALNLFGVPSSVAAGDTVSMVATVANFGPQVATDVRVELALPAELSFLSGRLIQGSGNWSCSAAGSLVTCQLVAGSLPVNQFAAVLQVELSAQAVLDTTSVQTVGEVSSSNDIDPNPGNNSSTVTTVIAGDRIFANGFESETQPGVPGIYTSRAAFLDNVATGFFEDPYNDITEGPAGPSLARSGNGFSYTITVVGSGTNNLFNGNGFISTDSALDAIRITFTGPPVTAIGGNFWATDLSFAATGGQIVLTLNDGTTHSISPSSSSSFAGFVTAAPIVHITIDAPDVPSDNWSTVDNLIVGQRR